MTKRLLYFASLAALIIMVAGCTNPFARRQTQNNPTNNIADTLERQSELRKFADAEELKEYFANRPNNNSSSSMTRNVMGLGESAQDSAAPKVATGMGGGGGFSGTNIQVAGVDEADIVKTDGNYIYTVSDKKLVIVSAVPPADAAIISEITLKGRPQELYIDGDKLITFGYEEMVYADAARSSLIRPMNSSTFLNVYSIADKKNPVLLKDLSFEGSYTASRMIDGRVYFISTTYSFYPADDILLPAVFEKGEKISGDESSSRYAYPDVYYIDTPSAYNATTVSVIDLANLDAPLYSNVYMMPAGQTVYASRGNLYLTYGKFISDYELRMTVAREMMSSRLPQEDRNRIDQIAAIDSRILSEDEKSMKINQVIESYLYRLPAAEQTVVMKELNDEFIARYDNLYKQMETTVVHKIAFADGRLNYVAAGEVSGHLLNQFSMDEDKGYFRMATTRGQSWIMPFPIIAERMMIPAEETRQSYNNVYVLDEDMKTVGSVENLAAGERIYSVRFMGDRGYVVTFKQTDPLFVLDLANAQAPAVIGQVKLPGFSNYLHPFNETILIGIGKEATDKGDLGVELGGVKISLFDVSDPAAPKEITSSVIGGRGSDSIAMYDHKAVLFSADKQLLSIPVTLTRVGSSDYTPEFQGALIMKVTASSLAERGRISHPASDARKAQGYGSFEQIQRTLYIGDYLYSLSQAQIQIHDLEKLTSIKEINLPVPAPIIDKPMPFSTPASPAIE